MWGVCFSYPLSAAPVSFVTDGTRGVSNVFRVHVLIREGDVLQNWEKPILPLQALDEVRHGMQSHQRIEWPAVIARAQA